MTSRKSSTATGLSYLQVQENLERLKMTQALSALDRLAEEARKKEWSYIEFLGKLLEEEMTARNERRLAINQRLAHSPWVKTLDQFDFDFQPGVDEKKSRELADQAPKDRADSRWVEKLRVLSHPRLLIIDEVGYVPLDPVVSYFVFSLVRRRYEKGPMIWTSNKGFAEWASVFAGDEVLTTAILDRLLHHGQ